MKYSEDRVGVVSLKIHDRLYLDNDVDYTDEDAALRAIKDAMLKFFKVEDAIDSAVHQKILSLKRGVMPGTPEWEVLYQKYFEEELVRHKLS
jgi:hypothetical protein